MEFLYLGSSLKEKEILLLKAKMKRLIKAKYSNTLLEVGMKNKKIYIVVFT